MARKIYLIKPICQSNEKLKKENKNPHVQSENYI